MTTEEKIAEIGKHSTSWTITFDNGKFHASPANSGYSNVLFNHFESAVNYIYNCFTGKNRVVVNVTKTSTHIPDPDDFKFLKRAQELAKQKEPEQKPSPWGISRKKERTME